MTQEGPLDYSPRLRTGSAALRSEALDSPLHDDRPDAVQVEPRPPSVVRRRRGWRGLRSTAMLTASTVAAQAFSMLGGLLIARSLGPVGRGQVSLVQVYDDASTTALSLGTPTAAGYFAKEQPDDEARVLGAALWISLVSLPVTAAIGWVVTTFAFSGAPIGVHLIVWAAVGMSPIANTYPNACRMVLVARGAISSLVPLQVAPMALRLVMIGALLFADEFTPTTAAGAVVVSGWLVNVFGVIMVGTRPARGGPVRDLLTYGVKTVPASLASMANTRLDQMLIAPLIGAGALGLYAVAVGSTLLPLNVGVSMALAGFHTVKGSDNFAGAGPLLRRAVFVISACCGVNAIGVVFLLEPLYGHEFRDAVVPALILMPGVAAGALFAVVAPVGNAIGAPGLGSWAQATGLAITAAGLPIVLPWLGINGAALVSTVAYSARLAVGIALLRRRGVRIRP